jgi:hypothetical protein
VGGEAIEVAVSFFDLGFRELGFETWGHRGSHNGGSPGVARVGRPLLPPVPINLFVGGPDRCFPTEKEQFMRKIVKHAPAGAVKHVAAGAVLGGSLLFTAGLGVAAAAPPAANAVDLAIGNIKILQNASLDQAVSVAGAVCNINTSQANSLAQKAATENSQQTVCNLPGGVVTFSGASSVNGGFGTAPGGTPNGPVNPMYPSEPQPQPQPR